MDIYFGAYWKQEVLTLGEFIERLHSFVQKLQALHPLLRNWQLVGDRPGKKLMIEFDLSNLRALAREYAWDRKAPKHWTSNLDKDSIPSLSSISEVGYRMLIENGDEDERGDHHVSCQVRAGTSSPWLSNAVVISITDKSPLRQSEVAIQVLRVLVESWRPDSAVFTSQHFSDLTYQSDDVGSIGWMTYFANPAISSALPKDVMQRPFGAHGVLISISPEMPLPGDAQAEEKAIRVAQALRNTDAVV